MTIRKRTDWETAKLYEIAQRMFNVSESVDYDLVVHEFENAKGATVLSLLYYGANRKIGAKREIKNK